MPELSKLALNAGELSDELAGRIDLSKFNSGCEILENAKVLRAGGVTRRAGFKYLGVTTPGSTKSRLVGFRFSETQGYVLEFTALKLRVHTAGAINVTEYDTPWTEDQIFDLQFAQRIDRIIVTHPEVPVQNIVRYAGGTWGVVAHPWQTRIWETYPSTDDFILTPGAVTGTTTITSDAALFDATWIGDRIKIEHTVGESKNEYDVADVIVGQVAFNASSTSNTAGDIVYEVTNSVLVYYICIADYDNTAVDSDGDYVAGNTLMGDYPTFFAQTLELVPPTIVEAGWVFETFGTWTGTYWVQRSYDGGTSWNTIKIVSSVDNRNERVTETEDQATLIRVILPVFENDPTQHVEFTINTYTASGSAVVDSFSTTTVVNVTVEKDFQAATASAAWYECAFSPRNGYPTSVTFYQSRLAFGGTSSRPQTLWLSRTQKPFDFTLGTLATDGMSFQTDAEGYESITWLSSHLSLLVGTTLGVWAISAPDGSSLTPENNGLNRQMQLGAQKGFQAAPLQNNVLFLQYKGRKIQELTGGSVEYGGYLSADLTQLASHVTRGVVTQIATGELPDSTLFLVSGGEIPLLTYERAQNVVGWARWKTEGNFESIAVTSGAGEDDDHYVVVNRNGNRYIEYLAPDMLRIEEDDDAVNLRFLDSYTEAIGTALTEVTGLTRFEGMEVDTFIDGEPHGLVTVTGGVATLPSSGDNVVVGLPYTTEVRPMSIDFGAIGSKSSVIELLIRFRNSLGGEVSQDRINWSKVAQQQPRITEDVPLSLLSQDFQSTPHSTWERKPSISVRQTQPLPMTILAMRIKTKSSK
jgi:hypothetical protein